MKLVKNVLIGLVVLVALVAGSVYGLSTYRMLQRVIVTDAAPVVPSDSATIAQGAYLVRAITKCGECHGPTLAGQLFFDGGPLGVFYAPNLTSGAGGRGAVLADSDFVRAIRHGVGQRGRKLQWMPSSDWASMADEDVAAVVAYVRSRPAVDSTLPPSRIGPLGRALYIARQLPLFESERLSHDHVTRPRPPAGATAEYGGYLANIGGCTGCHGPTLSGGRIPGTPPDMKPAANLTPEGIGHYTETDFFRALREAKRPNGTPIDPLMPVTSTKLMTDDDTRALFLYLKSVPPKAYGGR